MASMLSAYVWSVSSVVRVSHLLFTLLATSVGLLQHKDRGKCSVNLVIVKLSLVCMKSRWRMLTC